MSILLHNLFPIPVAQFHLESILEDEIKTVEEHSKKTYFNTNNKTSSERYILNDNFPRIKKFILESTQKYVDNVICSGPNVSFNLTQSWLNYTSPGESHHRHRHPNSFISGVFYFNANVDTDKIYFDSRTSGSRDYAIDIIPTKYNYYNSPTWWLPVQTGDLLLFPSYLCHYVEPVVGDETRVSLSFNLFPVGIIGDSYQLTELTLGSYVK